MTNVIIITSAGSGVGRTSLLTALARKSPGQTRVLDATGENFPLPGIASGALTRGRLADIPVLVQNFPATKTILVEAAPYPYSKDDLAALATDHTLVVVSSHNPGDIKCAADIVEANPGSLLVVNRADKASQPRLRRYLPGYLPAPVTVDGADVVIPNERNTDVLSAALDFAAIDIFKKADAW